MSTVPREGVIGCDERVPSCRRRVSWPRYERPRTHRESPQRRLAVAARSDRSPLDWNNHERRVASLSEPNDRRCHCSSANAAADHVLVCLHLGVDRCGNSSSLAWCASRRSTGSCCSCRRRRCCHGPRIRRVHRMEGSRDRRRRRAGVGVRRRHGRRLPVERLMAQLVLHQLALLLLPLAEHRLPIRRVKVLGGLRGRARCVSTTAIQTETAGAASSLIDR